MVDAPVAIRRLQVADLEAFKALRDEMLAAYPAAFSSDAEEIRDWPALTYQKRLGLDRPDAGDFVLGAFAGSSLVGALTCERESRRKVRHVAQLLGMMVRPEMQGRGIARALLIETLDTDRRVAGLEMLTLSVTAGNAAATRLYESLGFVRYGLLERAICVDGVYHAKEQMVLSLR